MQNIEQFVKEIQEIKLLQTCESYFLLFQKNMRCLSYKICLTKNYRSRYKVLPRHRYYGWLTTTRYSSQFFDYFVLLYCTNGNYAAAGSYIVDKLLHKITGTNNRIPDI